MTVGHGISATSAVLGLLLLAVWSMAGADLPVVTGEHWTKATVQEKKAFLLGMGTIIEIEREFQGKNPPKEIRDRSAIPELIEGLSNYTITTASQAIDDWYVKHPNQLNRPVMEVIWFELTLPNLKSEPSKRGSKP